VKILDFGVAKLTTVPDAFTTVTGTVLGTPFYMSPEQARGDVSVDARSEVWSVGAVMFHCLTGRPPYDEQNYNKLILRIMTERAPSLAAVAPGLPAWLVVAIDRALEPDPHKRWSSAALMAAALRAGEVAEGTSASLRFAPRRDRRGSVAPGPMQGAVTPRPDRALPVSARSIDETAPTIDTTSKQPAQTPAQWERAAPAASSRTLAFGALALAGLAIVVGGTALAVMGGDPPPLAPREHAAPRVRDPSPALDVAPPVEPPPVIEAEVADAGVTAVTALADAGAGVRRPGRDRAIAGGAGEEAGTMATTTMRRLGPIRVYE
jgi:serine/threonine-protein kinase